jgi:hypothetical protein
MPLCSYNAVGNEAHFMLECPLYKPIRDTFPSLFENAVLESLKSLFQLNHQGETVGNQLSYSSKIFIT